MSIIEETSKEVVEKVDSICRIIIDGGKLSPLKGETLLVLTLVVGTLQGYGLHRTSVAAGLEAQRSGGNVDDAIDAAEDKFEDLIDTACTNYLRRAAEASSAREDEDVAKNAQ